MTPSQKLQVVLKLSGLTQAELAVELGVTFAALNRWVNSKAMPRPKALAQIDDFYRTLTGAKQIPHTVLDAKEGIVRERQKRHPQVLHEILANPDIRDQFYLSLTYHSNRIEGSTLSENETAAVLFQNAALPTKSLTEQLEAKNHQAALEYLFEHLSADRGLDEALIVKLHSILMNAIRTDAGRYRNHAVRIMGTTVPTANYLKVPTLMRELAKDMARRTSGTTRHIAAIHSRFEQIHPFADGNGRIGRLLMHAMALRSNLPPVAIRQESRPLYVAYLNQAQTKEDLTPLTDFVLDALLRGFQILERDLGEARRKPSTFRRAA